MARGYHLLWAVLAVGCADTSDGGNAFDSGSPTPPGTSTTESGRGTTTAGDGASTGGGTSEGGETQGATGDTSGGDGPMPPGLTSTGGGVSTGGGETCGDGFRNGSEDCEGADLGGRNCERLGYLGGGTLVCNPDCTYDTSECLGPLCGEEPAPPDPSECPDACDTCTENRCQIQCSGTAIADPCLDRTVDCPEGWLCEVSCNNACEGMTVNCAPDSACDVTCTGLFGCDAMTVNCGVQSCHTCGNIPTVSCGDACDCDNSC